MANELDRGYFGVRLGDALSQGAGHIAGALQNKYMAQRQNRLLEEEKKRQAPLDALKIQEIMAGLEAHKAALEKTKAETAVLSQKPAYSVPAGFRATPTGLEAIPGGPADIKAQQMATKEKESVGTQNARIYDTQSAVDTAIKNLGFFSTGLGAETLAGFGGTEARTLKGYLDTIKGNLAFDRLTQMRNESKTGGALGNVSDRELLLLSSTAGSLDQGLPKKVLKQNLEKIKEILGRNIKKVPEPQKEDLIATTMQESTPILSENEVMRKNARTGEIGIFDKTTGQRIR